MYVWVGAVTAYVFSARRGCVQDECSPRARARGAFLLQDDARAPSVHWLMGAGTIVVAGVLTASLTRRVRAHQADLATVAQMAYGMADPDDFAGGGVRKPPRVGACRRRGAARARARWRGRGHRLRSPAAARPRACSTPKRAGERSASPLASVARNRSSIPSGTGGSRARWSATHSRSCATGAQSGSWPSATRASRGPSRSAPRPPRLFATEASVAMERAERQASARERRAIDINDNIVQGLTVAKYAIGQGHVDEGVRAMDDTLRRARQLITDQLTEATADQGGPRPGDLVRGSRVEGLQRGRRRCLRRRPHRCRVASWLDPGGGCAARSGRAAAPPGRGSRR